MDKKERLEMAYKFCSVLKNDAIKEEIDNALMGYDLDKIELHRGMFECEFFNNNGNSINFSIGPNMIQLYRYENDILSRFSVMEDQVLRQVDVDKRSGGVIFTEIEKYFSNSSRFSNKVVLVDLYEKRYVFKNDNILFMNDNLEKFTLMRLLLKFRSASLGLDLEKVCDLYNCFSTHMNNYVRLKNGRMAKDNIYPTKTYLNKEDVSYIFDVNDGFDKLYRVYDLYNGIINSRNENDINLINLGFLSTDAYNFRNLMGLNKIEDEMVGEGNVSLSCEYINYLNELFKRKFGYDGDLKLDRNSILKAITYYNPQTQVEKNIEVENKTKKLFKKLFKRK